MREFLVNRTGIRSSRDQARAGRFRSNGGSYLQAARSKIRAFKRGVLCRNQRVQQSVSAVDRASHHQFSLHRPSSPIEPAVTEAQQSEQITVNRLVESLYEGGYGFVEARKPPDVVRLMGNNVNNLSLYDETRSWKIGTIREINRRFQVDGMLLQECGTDFRQTPESKSICSLFGDNDCRSAAANNVTEDSGRTQHGGVAAMNFPRLAGFTTETGKDPTGWAGGPIRT